MVVGRFLHSVNFISRPSSLLMSDLPSPAAPRIADLPAEERPREKMLARGASSLTDAELLAIFFGSGTVGLSAIDLGRLFIDRYGSLHALSRLTVDDLQRQKGIGEAKALHLVAAFEMGKRLAREMPVLEVMDSSEAISRLVAAELRTEPLEVVKVVLLTSRLTLLGVEEISRGTINEAVCHPRDVLQPVIARRAFAFVLVHNHPSGNPEPSVADREITRRMKVASDAMGIHMTDHIIVGLPSTEHRGYFSFKDNAML